MKHDEGGREAGRVSEGHPVTCSFGKVRSHKTYTIRGGPYEGIEGEGR